MSKVQSNNLATATSPLVKAGSFIEENKKSLLVIGATIVGLIVLYVAYLNFYLKPREAEAANQIFKAQQYWEQKNWDKAIKGDGNYPGFEKIIEDYANTKSANIAYYYLGMAYLNTSQYQKAIDNLSNYNGSDAIIAPLALGGAADAYVELKNYDEAISYFKKAISKGDNLFAAPFFLKKLALVYEEQGDFTSALDAYKKIKTDYPESTENTNIDLYIARAEQKL